MYVGEAESIRDRIKIHNDKDFWNQVTFFISKDENLTKAHIRYLEGKLIEQAKSAGRAVVTNGQSSGSKLPESDRGEMEVFLEKINQLLPVLGIDPLVPMVGSTTDAPTSRLLYCEIKGLKATGFRSANGFLVRKGSEAVAIERPSSEKWPWTRNLRQKLKDDSVLGEKGDRLVFAVRTVSAARSSDGTVILSYPRSGCQRLRASGI
jgi:hypothetical protein